MHSIIYRFLSLVIVALFCQFSASSAIGNTLQNPQLKDALTLLQLEYILQQAPSSLLNETCKNELLLYSDGIKQKETWALQMLDSSWKIPSGIFKGNLEQMGLFDECISVGVQKGNDISFSGGRHCTLHWRIQNLHPLAYPRFSVCLPAVCDESAVDAIIQQLTKNSTVFQKIGMEYQFSFCSKIDSNTHTITEILALSILSLLVGMLVIITGCDVVDSCFGKFSPFTPIRDTFKYSIYRNGQSLFRKTQNEFPVIDGLRVISMIYIMLAHFSASFIIAPYVNSVDFFSPSILEELSRRIKKAFQTFQWCNTWTATLFLLGVRSVDTFFTISGFLVSYNFMKDVATGKKFNIIYFYIRRYFRLTPLLAITLLIQFLLPRVGSGPRWDFNNNVFLNGCYEIFWHILFYVQNFFRSRGVCMEHIWHLAAEMQLYILSPLFLHALAKKPKLGYFTIGLAVTLSMIFHAYTIVVHEISTPFSFNSNISEAWKSFKYTYTMPTTRIGPYIVGIILGHFVATKKGQLSRVYIKLGWFLTMVSYLAIILLMVKLTARDYERNIALEISFNCLSHPLWGVGVAWIIYTNHINNNRGYLGKFLSSRILTFLSKISYAFYLSHLLMPYFTTSTARTTLYWRPFDEIIKFILHFIIALIVAFFMTILFEMPVATLIKSLTKREIVAKKSY